ncbi:MAG: DMT family transporter [Firmicutes bacterium]|nr:DMT family transporter [Bacillota bacterium]
MSTRTKAILAVILGNTIFGFSFIFSKMALQITVPSVLIAVRFLTAFACLNLIVLVGRRIHVQGRPLVAFSLKGKPLRYVLLLALFQPILYFLCESYGIVYTSAAFAGTIIAVIPIAGIVFDVLIMHSKVRRRQVVCAVLSAAGVTITTIGAEGMKSSILGLLILLGAVASGALFYVFSKKSGDHYNPLEQTYVMFALGSVVYTVFALVQCRGQYHELIFSAFGEPAFVGGVLYLAVLSSVAAFIALNYGTVRVTVSEASIFANLTTVISIAAGVFFLHESFSLFQVAGAAVIIGSVYFANRPDRTGVL